MLEVTSQIPVDDDAMYIIEDLIAPTITLKAVYKSDDMVADDEAELIIEKVVIVDFRPEKIDVTDIARDWITELPYYTRTIESGIPVELSHVSGVRWLLGHGCLEMVETELFRIASFDAVR